MPLLMLLLCLNTTKPVEVKPQDTFELAGRMVWVTTMTDLISTELALAQPGIYEMNPVANNRARIPIKLGLTFASNFLTKKVADMGHRKTATIVRWCLVGAFAVATGNNIVISWGQK